jgi:hypothetical protein
MNQPYEMTRHYKMVEICHQFRYGILPSIAFAFSSEAAWETGGIGHLWFDSSRKREHLDNELTYEWTFLPIGKRLGRQ